LKGHERPLTVVKYNADGDLLLTAAKDKVVCLWSVETGERLGTYEGHSGAIYGLDITRDSRFLLTGSADNTVRVWELLTGRLLVTIEVKGPCHGVAWAEGDREFAAISDRFLAHPAMVSIYSFDPDAPEATSSVPRLVITDSDDPTVNYTKVGWLPLNEGVLVGLETGYLRSLDPLRPQTVRGEWRAHNDAITSFSFDETKTLMVTSSKDQSAALWDVKNMRRLHSYQLDVPCNAIALAPHREHVILGGGQEAMAVTTTAASAGKFETRFHHMVFQHELGRVKGHFGPINALAFSPDGRSFTSGAEDGFVRLHKLDADYLALGDDDNLEDPALAAALADGTYDVLEAEENEERAKQEAVDHAK
jgi:translation initiation factor 3 subunit I